MDSEVFWGEMLFQEFCDEVDFNPEMFKGFKFKFKQYLKPQKELGMKKACITV